MKTINPTPVNPTGFAVGDRVRHGNDPIRRARDYWLGCGRQPMKSGAKAELDRLSAERGTVTGITQNKYAWGVSVRWDSGSQSDCLSYMVAKEDKP